MSNLSKFADELEQLILSHAAEAGIDIAEGIIEHVIRVVTGTLFGDRHDKTVDSKEDENTLKLRESMLENGEFDCIKEKDDEKNG